MGIHPAAIETAEAAYDRAYAAHWTDVFRFALAWTNDWSAAEDLAQDSFAQLWRSRANVDWSGPVMPWLLRVTRNRATDRFRLVRRWLAGGIPDIAIRDSDRDTWIDLQTAMKRLTEAERTALVSVAVLGLTAAETARVLGITDGAVRAAISRGRQKLEGER
jgi:RNA polymerase sigma-70 factor, ECF subfamily